ncbi:MAG TPA: hypothetical protein PLQ29_08305 [Spirochaetales bacterium]|nr:hypothetical protein [Spirochaetales bacterium]
MIKRCMVIALTVAAVVCSVAAADEVGGSVYDRWPSSLGYAVNSEGGAGLSWQRWFGLTGVAVTAGGLYNEDGVDSPTLYGYDYAALDYNAQLRISRRLHTAEYSSWLSSNLQAVGLIAHRGYLPYEYVGYDETTYESLYARLPYVGEYMLGAGVAIEMTYYGHFSQTFDFMYVAKWPLELAIAFGTSFRYRY